MSWEQRGESRYYYQVTRDPTGRLVKTYIGTGILADQIATVDAWQRMRRQQALQAWRTFETFDRAITQFTTTVERLAAGHLIMQGYYRHKRASHWRKRRSWSPPPTTTSSHEETSMDPKESETHHTTTDDLQHLVQQGMDGNAEVVPVLKALLQDPVLLNSLEQMGREIESRLLDYMTAGNPAEQAAMRLAQQVRHANLTSAMAQDGAFEQQLFHLLAEEVLLCRLQSRHADTIDARHGTLTERDQKRQDRAHRRYHQALKTLAQVKKLLTPRPSVQVNVAQNQMNFA
jgi:hypothetical protein